MEPPAKRRKYEASFKLRVIEVAKASNNCVAARTFDVAEKLVRDWIKNEDKLRSMPKQKCAMRRGNSHWPELDDHVAQWVQGLRQDGYIVTRNKIRSYALKWANNNRDKGKDFKATVGWCNRFMNRKNLVIRQKTKIAQKLPRDLDHKVTNFHRFVIGMRQKHQFSLSCIGNMDETPLNFDMMGNRTVDVKGTKTVHVRNTGHVKTRFTVALSCMADGTKLKPMVIFKRKTKPKINFPSGVFVHFHEKGWMDENGIKLWIENIWNRRPGGIKKQQSLLVWDMFRSHITKNSKDRLSRHNTEIAVIPGGLTSLLQPLDVSLNKPFKDYVREEWNNWMQNEEKSFTKGGSMRAASLDVLCEMVIKSWDKVKTESVVKSFKKCGISNAMDGTEDDLLYESEDEEEVDSPDPTWDPYDETVNDDVYDELFVSDDDDDSFDGF